MRTPQNQSDNLRDTLRHALQTVAPPPSLNISEWADTYRHLSQESSALPGRWLTSRAPYQREIMNTLCDPSIEQVVFVKSSQVGATEILNNIVGYFMHQDPSTVLLVQPTLDLGGAWSKDRLVPMIRDTRVLSDLVHKPRATETTNTILAQAIRWWTYHNSRRKFSSFACITPHPHIALRRGRPLSQERREGR